MDGDCLDLAIIKISDGGDPAYRIETQASLLEEMQRYHQHECGDNEEKLEPSGLELDLGRMYNAKRTRTPST